MNGGWTGWSSWSDCSATCGSGLMIRQRSCSSPQPANGGSGCSGEAIEHKSCEVRVCPGISNFVKRNNILTVVTCRH